jgi:hypothetical protein
LLLQKSGPFVVVALQECARMNALLGEIRRSLGELDKGEREEGRRRREAEEGG